MRIGAERAGAAVPALTSPNRDVSDGMSRGRAFQAADDKRLKAVTPIRQLTELQAMYTHVERSHVTWYQYGSQGVDMPETISRPVGRVRSAAGCFLQWTGGPLSR
jgi:hypothetical protein